MELNIKLPGMDIGLYIAEILQDQGRVSIPGVGAFYRKKTAAYFNHENRVFFPPAQKLEFERSENNDNSLARYISTAESISTASADDLIREFALKFNYELDAAGSAIIDGIGILKKENNDYTVEDFSSYGLQPVKEAEFVSGDAVVHQETENVHVPTVQEEKELADTRVENIPAEFEEETEARSGNYWLYIIPVLLLAGLAYFFYPQIRDMLQERQVSNAPVTLQPSGPRAIPQDPEDSLAYSQLEQRITSSQQADSVKSNAAGPVSYEIIVVTFNRKSDAEAYIRNLTAVGSRAEAYIRDLAAKGINVHIIEKSSGSRFEVSTGSFKDKASAETELRMALKNISRQAWIDTIKIKTD